MRLSGLWIVPLALAALCAPASVTLASPGALTTTVEVAEDDILMEQINGFDVVRLRAGLSTKEEGHPELPLMLVRFALPDGAVAVSAEARVLSRSELPGSFLVRPRQPEVPLSMTEATGWIDPDAEAYASQLPYPEQSCVLLGSGSASGQGIATVAFYPVQYIAAERTLHVNETTEIALTIEFAPTTARVPGPLSQRSAGAAAERARALVVNPEAVIDRSAGPRAGRGETDYLIITPST
ncbi:MAG: hypothetical protein U9Q95_03830, partial [Candidatus Eisenbacteria bacterium]|nr:hypothetical protein [Candidatus Eisenbacteria bacterium]